jgi:ribose 5-phosphate isomerase
VSDMNTDTALLKKQRAARAALGYLNEGMILGVGTGSTVNALIDLLASEGWAQRLRGASPVRKAPARGFAVSACRYSI